MLILLLETFLNIDVSHITTKKKKKKHERYITRNYGYTVFDPQQNSCLKIKLYKLTNCSEQIEIYLALSCVFFTVMCYKIQPARHINWHF